VEDLIRKHISGGAITTSENMTEAIDSTEVTFITVGTPSREDGSMDDTYIRSASSEIGTALRNKKGYQVVVMKSTVVPGTTKNVIRRVLERSSGLLAGKDFGLAMCPEFLREGAAMHDSLNPDRIVIGTEEDSTFEILSELFGPLGSKMIRTSPTSAEMIKYTSNSFLATKISFANEVSRICEDVGVDVYEIMEGVGSDFRISPHFLRAGVGFGGSCFPKDVSALIYTAKQRGIDTPILDGVMETNELQPKHLVEVAERTMGQLTGRKVAVLGLAFKPDTDDIRSTRSLPVIESLLEKGAIIGVHDPKAESNFRDLELEVRYFTDVNELVDWSNLVFLMTEWPEYAKIDWAEKHHIDAIFDGRRTVDIKRLGKRKYWSMGSPLPSW
jgi:UDPglucose 6-dehydrogenase